MLHPRPLLSISFALLLTASLTAFGQQSGGGGTGGGSTGSGGSGGSTGSGSGTGTSGRPGTLGTTNTQPREPERQIIFISGNVVTAYGNPPTEQASIERVCPGLTRREAHTDSQGQFSFQLGGPTFELQDASIGANPFSSIDSGSTLNQPSSPSLPGVQQQGVTQRDLLGCELRAVLPGYRSTTVMIRPEGNFGILKVGTIILEPLNPLVLASTSVTTMQAPKDARKAFEKAQRALEKNKTDEAEKNLQKAVTVYPRYADAWAMLGMLHGDENKMDVATSDFQQALAADPQLVKPHFGLAIVAMHARDWQAVVRETDEVTRHEPGSYPDAFYYNALANWTLGKVDIAETNLRRFKEFDKTDRRPEAHLLAAQLRFAHKDYVGALEQTKAFLKAAPDSTLSAGARQDVQRLEQLTHQTAQNQPPAQQK